MEESFLPGRFLYHRNRLPGRRNSSIIDTSRYRGQKAYIYVSLLIVDIITYA